MFYKNKYYLFEKLSNLYFFSIFLLLFISGEGEEFFRQF